MIKRLRDADAVSDLVRPGPQSLARVRVQALHQLRPPHDELARAPVRDDLRRAIARAVRPAAPYQRAGAAVQCQHAAPRLRAHVQQHARPVHHGGGGEAPGGDFRAMLPHRVHLPHHRARGRVQAAGHARGAERVGAALVQRHRGAAGRSRIPCCHNPLPKCGSRAAPPCPPRNKARAPCFRAFFGRSIKHTRPAATVTPLKPPPTSTSQSRLGLPPRVIRRHPRRIPASIARGAAPARPVRGGG